MTLGGWFVFSIIALSTFGLCVGVGFALEDPKTIAISVLVATVICGVVLSIMLFYYNGTARGKRAFKTQESDLNNGIERKVEVYDAVGNLIKTYEGKFDIDYDDDRIIFDDENNKRHVIYYPTGTIIVDEV